MRVVTDAEGRMHGANDQGELVPGVTVVLSAAEMRDTPPEDLLKLMAMRADFPDLQRVRFQILNTVDDRVAVRVLGHLPPYRVATPDIELMWQTPGRTALLGSPWRTAEQATHWGGQLASVRDALVLAEEQVAASEGQVPGAVAVLRMALRELNLLVDAFEVAGDDLPIDHPLTARLLTAKTLLPPP